MCSPNIFIVICKNINYILSAYYAAKITVYAVFAHKYTYIIYNKTALLSREILSAYIVYIII